MKETILDIIALLISATTIVLTMIGWIYSPFLRSIVLSFACCFIAFLIGWAFTKLRIK